MLLIKLCNVEFFFEKIGSADNQTRAAVWKARISSTVLGAPLPPPPPNEQQFINVFLCLTVVYCLRISLLKFSIVEKVWEGRESNLGRLDEKRQKRFLCAMPSPLLQENVAGNRKVSNNFLENKLNGKIKTCAFLKHWQVKTFDFPAGQSFKSRQVYLTIDLTCTRLPNTTKGDWFWTDEGKLVQVLPPCEVRGHQNFGLNVINKKWPKWRLIGKNSPVKPGLVSTSVKGTSHFPKLSL